MVALAASGLDELRTILISFPGVRDVKKVDLQLQVFFEKSRPDLAAINQYCFEKGIVLNHLELRKRSLESKFIELTNNVSN